MARSLFILFVASTLLLEHCVARNIWQMTVDMEERIFLGKEKQMTSLAVTFSFAKHFQSNMVLQQSPRRARIYGFSPDIGGQVNIVMKTEHETYNYTVPVTNGHSPGVGMWSVSLDPIQTGLTAQINAQSAGRSISLSNIIFGDVWLCSGQSNMEFVVSQMFKGAEEIADAHNYPNIRLMTAAMKASTTPLDDLIEIAENWTYPSNDSIGHPAWTYFSAVCWLYGKAMHKALGYPIGLVATDWGGTPVEAWSSPDALKKCGLGSDPGLAGRKSNSRREEMSYAYTNGNIPKPDSSNLAVGGPDQNSVLWNAMIHPFLGMTIYGAIWYQGENDASGAKMNRYNCTFPAMIEDWRLKFHNASGGQTNSSFPFGFVQLSANSPNTSIDVGFPDIRWHQTADVGYVPNSKMPNVFMAVAMDLPDFNSSYGAIHPRDKTDVGVRLSLSGLSVAYGRPEVYQGPFPVGGHGTAQAFILDYGTRTTLDVRNRSGFEFFCKDSKVSTEGGGWTAAYIKDFNSTAVVLSSTCAPGAVMTSIRYAWRESPCPFKACAVYSTTNQLPGPPFVFPLSTGDNGLAYFET